MTKQRGLSIEVEVEEDQRYDVVVVGGGMSGVVAAIAAARTGARTALVEDNSFLGGTAVNAGGLPFLGFHNKQKQLVVRGIGLEIVERLQRIGAASEFFFDPIVNSLVAVNGHWLKILLMEMTQEAGVDLRLRSMVFQVAKKNHSVCFVYLMNKQGCQRLAGKVFVDATDTADIAVQAGVPYLVGRREDQRPQVASFCIRVGNIDFDRLLMYFEAHPDQIRPFDLPPNTLASLIEQMRYAPFITGGLRDLVAEAIQDGIEFPRDLVPGVWFPTLGEALIVASRVENVDLNDVVNYSEAERTGQLQVKEIMRFIREYLPGGERARLIETGHQMGVRETRHIVGEYELTLEDLLNGRRFPDRIALGAYHVDVHTPDHKGLASYVQPPTYTIPYRCLLPQDVDNVLVAGRCISASHEAQASTRVIPVCMAIGHAAGTAAALSSLTGVSPKSLDIARLQKTLLEQAAELGQTIWQDF